MEDEMEVKSVRRKKNDIKNEKFCNIGTLSPFPIHVTFKKKYMIGEFKWFWLPETQTNDRISTNTTKCLVFK